ncbi:HEAT repeat domain-containing protein [Candidatus Cyanaurora vandensis]|uniref:HEAT repeat domain-containing protein n=1 Tax=Candidatus Cyanaurora vandensis TaxID=2714958 RepID=UPI00257FBBD6|nr:hypothetical protein [Candidatus Cyanaurora vandensis]
MNILWLAQAVESNKPADVASLITTFGPAGLFTILLLIASPFLSSSMKEAHKDDRQGQALVFQGVFVGVWVVIAGLTLYIVWAWNRATTQEAMIQGEFSDLVAPAKITSRAFRNDPALFLSSEVQENGRITYAWLLLPGKNQKIKFFLDRTPPCNPKSIGGSDVCSEANNITKYELMIHPDFYKNKVQIDYDSESKKLFLANSEEPELLQIKSLDDRQEPTEDDRQEPIVTGSALDSSLFAWLKQVGVAYAQSALPANKANDYNKLLEADDLNIRLDARANLAAEGHSALGYIQKILSNPQSSYRLRLGALTALGKMDRKKDGLNPNSLSDQALTNVIEASADPDSALRRAARGVISRAYSPEMAKVFEEVLTEAKAESSKDQAQRLDDLAWSGLQMYYQIGVEQKDLFRTRRDEQQIQASLQAFARGWQLRSEAKPESQYIFAKALYGHGLALHDQSVIAKSPASSKAAQAKFREFIGFLTQVGQNRYPYPHHLTQAKNYIINPVAASLS